MRPYDGVSRLQSETVRQSKVSILQNLISENSEKTWTRLEKAPLGRPCAARLAESSMWRYALRGGHKIEDPQKQSRDVLLQARESPFRKKVEAAHHSVCVEAVN